MPLSSLDELSYTREPRLVPGPGDVVISRVDINDIPHYHIPELRKLLSPDELEKSQRFRFPVHQLRYIVRHGILRLILSQYIHVPADELEFDYLVNGKPALSAQYRSSIHFNLSHSNDIVLYAFTSEREVGVDVERIRPEIIHESIPEMYFSPDETRTLRALPERLQARAFYDCWTRKEAYIKALGVGMSLDLNSFDVSLHPDEPAALLDVRPDHYEVERWSISAIDLGEEYAAAVVAEGAGLNQLMQEFSTAHRADQDPLSNY